MNSPYQIQVGFIFPVLDELAKLGVNIDYFLAKSELNQFDLNRMENYVHSAYVYRFFALLARYEGLIDIVHELSKKIQIVSQGLWGEMVATKPYLLSSMHFTTKYDKVQLSYESISLQIQGRLTKYQCKYHDNDLEGKETVISIIMATTMNFLKMVGGENWYPLEIHFPGKLNTNIENFLPEDHKTKIYFNQPELAVTLPTGFLACPLNGSIHSSTPKYLNYNHSLQRRIFRIISSTEYELIPTVGMVADQLDMSIRSLQRKLDLEGINYSEMIDQWRMCEALKHIDDPAKSNKEISQLLRYSNHQAFERAFQRWTRVTPSNYRDEQDT